MKAWGYFAAEKKQKDITIVDHIMINHDIAIVRELCSVKWGSGKVISATD